MIQYDCFEIKPHKLAIFMLSLDVITHTQWNEIDSVINQAEKEKADADRIQSAKDDFKDTSPAK